MLPIWILERLIWIWVRAKGWSVPFILGFILGSVWGIRNASEFAKVIESGSPWVPLIEPALPYITGASTAFLLWIVSDYISDHIRRIHKTHRQEKREWERERQRWEEERQRQEKEREQEFVEELCEKYSIIGDTYWQRNHVAWTNLRSQERQNVEASRVWIEELTKEGLFPKSSALSHEEAEKVSYTLMAIAKQKKGIKAVRERVRELNKRSQFP